MLFLLLLPFWVILIISSLFFLQVLELPHQYNLQCWWVHLFLHFFKNIVHQYHHSSVRHSASLSIFMFNDSCFWASLLSCLRMVQSIIEKRLIRNLFLLISCLIFGILNFEHSLYLYIAYVFSTPQQSPDLFQFLIFLYIPSVIHWQSHVCNMANIFLLYMQPSNLLFLLRRRDPSRCQNYTASYDFYFPGQSLVCANTICLLGQTQISCTVPRVWLLLLSHVCFSTLSGYYPEYLF